MVEIQEPDTFCGIGKDLWIDVIQYFQALNPEERVSAMNFLEISLRTDLGGPEPE